MDAKPNHQARVHAPGPAAPSAADRFRACRLRLLFRAIPLLLLVLTTWQVRQSDLAMRSPSVLERLSGGGTALSTRFKVLWVAVFISVGVFFWSVYHSDSPPPWSSWTSVSSSAHGLAIRPGSFSFGDALPARPPTERVWLNRVETARSEQLGRNDALHSTMIVIFSGTKFQTVAKYFFESMKRQKNVDLVMVQHGDHCIDLEPYSGGSPNIRVSRRTILSGNLT